MEKDKLSKGHKLVFGAVIVSTVVILGALGAVSKQKQNLEAVPYPVYPSARPTVLPTASVSAQPSLTPRTQLRVLSPRVVKPTIVK